jgi:hypothetical protein
MKYAVQVTFDGPVSGIQPVGNKVFKQQTGI